MRTKSIWVISVHLFFTNLTLRWLPQHIAYCQYCLLVKDQNRSPLLMFMEIFWSEFLIFIEWKFIWRGIFVFFNLQKSHHYEKEQLVPEENILSFRFAKSCRHVGTDRSPLSEYRLTLPSVLRVEPPTVMRSISGRMRLKFLCWSEVVKSNEFCAHRVSKLKQISQVYSRSEILRWW